MRKKRDAAYANFETLFTDDLQESYDDVSNLDRKPKLTNEDPWHLLRKHFGAPGGHSKPSLQFVKGYPRPFNHLRGDNVPKPKDDLVGLNSDVFNAIQLRPQGVVSLVSVMREGGSIMILDFAGMTATPGKVGSILMSDVPLAACSELYGVCHRMQVAAAAASGELLHFWRPAFKGARLDLPALLPEALGGWVDPASASQGNGVPGQLDSGADRQDQGGLGPARRHEGDQAAVDPGGRAVAGEEHGAHRTRPRGHAGLVRRAGQGGRSVARQDRSVGRIGGARLRRRVGCVVPSSLPAAVHGWLEGVQVLMLTHSFGAPPQLAGKQHCNFGSGYTNTQSAFGNHAVVMGPAEAVYEALACEDSSYQEILVNLLSPVERGMFEVLSRHKEGADAVEVAVAANRAQMRVRDALPWSRRFGNGP